MKKYGIFLLMITMLSGSGAVMAAGLSTKVDYSKQLQAMQDKENKDLRRLQKRYHERINWDNELKLSEQQKIYLKQIMTESRKKIDEQIKAINEAHNAIEKIYEEDNAKVRKVLTPQQQLKFDRAMYRWKKAHDEKYEGEKPSTKRMKQY